MTTKLRRNRVLGGSSTTLVIGAFVMALGVNSTAAGADDARGFKSALQDARFGEAMATPRDCCWIIVCTCPW